MKLGASWRKGPDPREEAYLVGLEAPYMKDIGEFELAAELGSTRMGNPGIHLRRATSLIEPGGGPISTASAYEIGRIGPPASTGAICERSG